MTKGARLMLSDPPATTRLPSPALIMRAAAMTASMPEAHSLFTVIPGTLCGRPASNKAIRAILRLSSPAWLAAPRITSSTAVQSRSGWRAISALIGCAARSSARTADSAPPNLPMGERWASQINTSDIGGSSRALSGSCPGMITGGGLAAPPKKHCAPDPQDRGLRAGSRRAVLWRHLPWAR